MHKPNNKLVSIELGHFWCTNEPWANMDSQDSPWPGLGGSHHLPHCNIICAWPWDKHPNVILSQNSQLGVPKFPTLGLLRLWKPITLCANLRLRWGLKQSYNPRRDLFNTMWHVTYTQRNQGGSWLLVVWPFFWPYLCFKCSNGSCKPV